MDKQALSLTRPGQLQSLTFLAALCEDIFQLSAIGEQVDLENTVNMLEDALNDLVEGHPDFIRVTISLAKLFSITGTPYTNTERAFSSLAHMLGNSPGSAYRCIVDVVPVLKRVESDIAPKWMTDDPARKELLNVYQALIGTFPRLVSLDMDLAHRIQFLSRACNLATIAASHAITLKQLRWAIELLESGRAVFWAQHLRLRMSFDGLDSQVAKELRDISRRLEVTVSPNIPHDLDSNLARARMERITTERRRLSIRFGEIVSQVRSQAGMDQFMRNLDFTSLSLAATRGPVVIFQPSWMCVITEPHTDPHIIPLHDITH
jgi:hypothetical protein